MTARLIIACIVLLPTVAIAAETSEGEKIFDAKCSQCHTFAMAQGMLQPMPAEKRPAHLEEFLKTHPAKLNESEKRAVIAALSRAPR